MDDKRFESPQKSKISFLTSQRTQAPNPDRIEDFYSQLARFAFYTTDSVFAQESVEPEVFVYEEEAQAQISEKAGGERRCCLPEISEKDLPERTYETQVQTEADSRSGKAADSISESEFLPSPGECIRRDSQNLESPGRPRDRHEAQAGAPAESRTEEAAQARHAEAKDREEKEPVEKEDEALTESGREQETGDPQEEDVIGAALSKKSVPSFQIQSKYFTAVPTHYLSQTPNPKVTLYQPEEAYSADNPDYAEETEDTAEEASAQAEAGRTAGTAYSGAEETAFRETADGEFRPDDWQEDAAFDIKVLEKTEIPAHTVRSGHRKKQQKKPGSFVKRAAKEAMIWILLFVCAFFITVIVNIYVIRANYVDGSSMVPTLQDGDKVYTSMLPYLFHEPKVGDIVVIDVSQDSDMNFFDSFVEYLKNNTLTKQLFGKNAEADKCWIKRIVGVEGDVLKFQDGKFYRNGIPVEEDYINEQIVTNYPSDTEIVVGKGMIFVMGDNRNASLDSRMKGQFSVNQIIGKKI